MGRTNGYYKGCLEMNGFKTPFVVYASSSEHAARKALKCVGCATDAATIQEMEGPFYYLQM